MEKQISEILNSLSKDVDRYKDVDLDALELQNNKDGRFEERMVRFISNTLPKELKILKIDAFKGDWLTFENSLTNIIKKLKFIGAEELLSCANTLAINYQMYHNFNKLDDKISSFEKRVLNLLSNIKDLFIIEE